MFRVWIAIIALSLLTYLCLKFFKIKINLKIAIYIIIFWMVTLSVLGLMFFILSKLIT